MKGTQPKKYYKNLSKDTKKKRADYFKNKDTTKNDNRPLAGDKGVKLNQVFTHKNIRRCLVSLRKDLQDGLADRL